jgi:SPP1 gp7 family putative phage head morphogenesis protein
VAPPADPDRFEEAVRAFRRRVPITDPEYEALLDSEMQRAFWVAHVTEARAVQQVFNAVDRAVADGTTLEDFHDDVDTVLEPFGITDPTHIETIFRTNVMGAYNAGRTEVFSDPEVQKARPYLRFDAVGDSRTSKICEALNGTILPADDPFWRTHTPPLHHNCRSILTALNDTEADDEGVTSGKPDTNGAAPDEGFGRPADPENWEPDIGGLDPDLRKLVRDRIE